MLPDGRASSRQVFIAYPRLDCSFTGGRVPETEEPLSPLRERWRDFLGGLVRYHEAIGDHVLVDKRPNWEFDLPRLTAAATANDLVYVPHRLKRHFDVGDNALFYKMSAFPDHFTVDPLGWGADLSFCPIRPEPGAQADEIFAGLVRAAGDNISKFEQPAIDRPLEVDEYDLFLCQIPHDEAIRFHSSIGVPDALAAVLDYSEARGRRLVVKGHPANPRAMLPLRALTEARNHAVWVDDVSIHRCLAGAGVVFLVNSGSGFEAMLHRKPVVSFGRAEYSSVVARASLDPDTIGRAAAQEVDEENYIGLIGAFIERCVNIRDQRTYERVERAIDAGRALHDHKRTTSQDQDDV